ncbi:MAG: hypothetical protein MGG37_03025 [Trichodesmium sp. MAG_R01]|nr:hypothetical protein [Trichodesmium sp. MAG_R01]
MGNQVVLVLWVCTSVWQEQTNWWLLPKVNITVFHQVLADLAEHFGNRKNKCMISLCCMKVAIATTALSGVN